MRAIARRQRLPAAVSARTESGTAGAQNLLFIAAVHAPDGVRFATAAASRRELVRRLAEYVRQRGEHVLCPDHARHLRGLLARGEMEGAVELYFGVVGPRWDEEWLVTAVVTADDRADIAAVSGEVVVPEVLSGQRRLRDAS